jgi:hypothetical protein
MTQFFHRTCIHQVGKIITNPAEGTGTLFPHTQPLLGVKLIWMTHVRNAPKETLGLRQHLLTCDRSAILLELTDPHLVVPWRDVRESFEPQAVLQLEAARGARPDYWWVSGSPQNVKLVEE